MASRWLLAGYVRELERLLPLGRRARRRYAREIHDHLDDLTDGHLARGLGERDAQLAAIDAFGGPDEAASRFGVRREPTRPVRLAAAAAALAVVATFVVVLVSAIGDGQPAGSQPTASQARGVDASGRADLTGTGATGASPATGEGAAETGGPIVLAANREPVLGVLTGPSDSHGRMGRAELVLFDPERFPRLQGQRLDLRDATLGGGLALIAPDRRSVAWTTMMDPAELEIVDLTTFRSRGVVRLVRGGALPRKQGRRRSIRLLGWASPELIVAVIQTNLPPYTRRIGRREIVLVDPQQLRVVGRITLTSKGRLGWYGQTSDRFLFVRQTRTGRPVLHAIDSEGQHHARPIDAELGEYPWLFAGATGAGGPDDERVFFPAEQGRAIAELDPSTLATTIHALGGETSVTSGPPQFGSAAWIVVGLAAGTHLVVTDPERGGVASIDLTTWNVTTIDSTANRVVVAGDLVLTAHGSAFAGAQTIAGTPGLVAYRVTGDVAYRALAADYVEYLTAAGPYVVAGLNLDPGSNGLQLISQTIVDPETGLQIGGERELGYPMTLDKPALTILG